MQRVERVRQVAEWGVFPWLFAGFSTRLGGVSRVFAGGEDGGDLNLGFGARGEVEDPAEAVAENRRRLLEAAGGGWELVVVRQVHGVEVREVSRALLPEAMVGGRGQWAADGLVTGEAGLLLGAGAADCVPLLVADTRQRVVGAFHAGWRGSAAGMAEVALGRMAERYGTRATECVAAVGPSIGPCCYEVGEEVAAAFGGEPGVLRASERGGSGAATEQADGRDWAGEGHAMLDLWEVNRRQLVQAGVPSGAVTVVGECTACSREADGRRRYFSHRAEAGRTGRMLGVIGVRAGSRQEGGGDEAGGSPVQHG